jgi:hypothetical protein
VRNADLPHLSSFFGMGLIRQFMCLSVIVVWWRHQLYGIIKFIDRAGLKEDQAGWSSGGLRETEINKVHGFLLRHLLLRDSLVNIAVGVRVPVGVRFSYSSRGLYRFWSPPSLQYVQGGSFHGVKQHRHESGHLPPTNAEVKNTWIYTSTPSYAFMEWCLIS